LKGLTQSIVIQKRTAVSGIWDPVTCKWPTHKDNLKATRKEQAQLQVHWHGIGSATTNHLHRCHKHPRFRRPARQKTSARNSRTVELSDIIKIEPEGTTEVATATGTTLPTSTSSCAVARLGAMSEQMASSSKALMKRYCCNLKPESNHSVCSRQCKLTSESRCRTPGFWMNTHVSQRSANK
jgi:hypothetical protein